MNIIRSGSAFIVVVLLFPAPIALADEKLGGPDGTRQSEINRIEKLLNEPVIETAKLKDEMRFERFLAAVEAQLPRDKKIALRMDREALGKELPRLAEASVKITGWQEKLTLHELLYSAMHQVEKTVEVDYAVQAGAVMITRPKVAGYTIIYDVRELNESLGVTTVVQQLMDLLELRPWETLDINNGKTLVLHATGSRHFTVNGYLRNTRSFVDVAVRMYARLYEIDRAFYKKHIAPLAQDREGDKLTIITRVSNDVLDRIKEQKLLLEDDDLPIRPGKPATFLSRRSAVRYDAGSQGSLTGRRVIGTVLAGVSFDAETIVTADRRYLALRITQNVSQLVGIDKASDLDPRTGKEEGFEVPNVRKSSIEGRIVLPDGSIFMMPVNYRPAIKTEEDKIWLLVARPVIWIEAEELLRGNSKLMSHRKAIWSSGLAEVESPPAPVHLALNEDSKEILQAIITDVLTNPKLRPVRDGYGPAQSRILVLADGDTLAWPKGFQPDSLGYALGHSQLDPFASDRRSLGLVLEKFELTANKSGDYDIPIQLKLFNAGGWPPDAGGWPLEYKFKRVDKHWAVELKWLFDR